jgi:hypothetical protein
MQIKSIPVELSVKKRQNNEPLNCAICKLDRFIKSLISDHFRAESILYFNLNLQPLESGYGRIILAKEVSLRWSETPCKIK